MIRSKKVKSQLSVKAPYKVEIIRNGKVIDTEYCFNVMPQEGRNAMLNSFLRNTAPPTAIYMAIYEGNYTPSGSELASTIASASTESTAYTETARRTVTYAAASASSVNNSASPCQFTMNATKIIYGCFISSDNSKNGTGGVLTSVVRFATAKNVVSTDVIQISHTATLSST